MPPTITALIGLGVFAGIMGGMFGIGGGAIMVPALVLWMGMDQKFATGTSLAAQLLPVALLGVGVYSRNDNLSWKFAGLLAAGLLVGNLLGALLANQPWVSGAMMKKAYGVFLLAIGARYLFFK